MVGILLQFIKIINALRNPSGIVEGSPRVFGDGWRVRQSCPGAREGKVRCIVRKLKQPNTIRIFLGLLRGELPPRPLGGLQVLPSHPLPGLRTLPSRSRPNAVAGTVQTSESRGENAIYFDAQNIIQGRLRVRLWRRLRVPVLCRGRLRRTLLLRRRARQLEDTRTMP